MSSSSLDLPSSIQTLIDTIQTEIETGRQRALASVEHEKVTTYWKIGKHIKVHLLENETYANHGEFLFETLSKALKINARTLYYAVQFYEEFPETLNARSKLTWTHIRSLLSVSDKRKRNKLVRKAIQEQLSTRELSTLVQQEKTHSRTSTKNGVKPLSVHREKPYVYQYIKWGSDTYIDLGFKVYIVKPNRPPTIGDVTHYTYKAIVTEVLDGDTFWAKIDLGFDVWTFQKLRLRGINTKEVQSLEGQHAKLFVEKKLQDCSFVAIRTYWRDKFDRYLVDVFYEPGATNFEDVVFEGAFLNQELLDEGLGSPYDG